ncbi:hypothetical protein SAMN05421869_108314 [Nonomuraea jiangxiensis]|uniref:Uncharacterized protein n=1 Tax=Nonomuraea jiangxiensis TaxID=633440 RepID=A0A1G8QP06_9ACTN|nr:hypothetical protein SAMN05421869_108314 [Nonomuraea jiangxiensis]
MMPALLTRMCSARPEDRKASAKASTEAGSIRSSRSISTPSIPRRASAALPGWRTGTTTRAPARRRTRVVSRPMPEWPPVTTAVLPVRSMPSMTSSAVLAASNGVSVMGC